MTEGDTGQAISPAGQDGAHPTPDSGIAAGSQTAGRRLPLPDCADIIFLLILALLIHLLPNFVLEDGSTGWHLVTGQYILQHQAIPATDLFSYTFPTKAWVPYEWLFDLLSALLLNIGGIKLVAVTVSCALALLFSMVYLACRKERCHFLLCILFTILGILTSTIHWLARPHLFTFFGVFIYAITLERFRRGQLSPRRFLITLGLTMIVWANAHPAFLVGLAMIGIYAGCEALIAISAGEQPVKAAAWRRTFTLWLGLMVAFLASLVNPNGFQLYAYISQYLHQSSVLSTTAEYMQPNFRQLHAVCMLLLVFALTLGLLLSKRKLALSPFVTAAAFVYLGFTSMRNEPLLVLVLLPTIAWLYADCDLSFLFAARDAKKSDWLEHLTAFFARIGATVDEVETSCNMHIAPLLATAVLVISCFYGGNLAGKHLVKADFDPLTKPTTTLAALAELPAAGGFNLDNWGGYLAYKTGKRLFIDDRLDFYGQKFFIDYGRIVSVQGNWRALLDKYKINWVLMPKSATLILALQDSPDWQQKASDQASALMVRKLLIKNAAPTSPDNAAPQYK